MVRYGKYIFPLLFCIAFSLSISGQNKPSYEVELLGISSPVFSDMAPVITADGIIFCSNRRRSVVKDTRTWDNDRLYDIYFSSKTEKGRYTSPRLFSKEMATTLHEGPLCFSPDGKSVYFTRSIEVGKSVRKKNRVNRNGIFIADKQGDSWVNVRPFEHNSQEYNVGHPAISSDGKTLYFSSDKPGGSGRYDIYYCELVNGKWGEPINAGSKINTRYSEGYPTIHPSGRLYFSSDRPATRQGDYGGLDIYYSTMAFGEWTDPVLMAEPINSSADDFAFTAYPDGQSGYFTSSRRRNDDIYSFVSIIIRKESCSEQEINSFCYEFYEVNAVRFDTIPFEYEWDFGDGTKASGVRADHCFPGPGTYIVSLNSTNLITKEVKLKEVSYTLKLELVEQPYITGPDSCRVGEQVLFHANESHLPGWDVERYYWNFGDETVAEGEHVPKVFTEPGTYEIQLIVNTKPERSGVVREACVSRQIVVLRDR